MNNHGWSNSTALPSGSVEAKVLEEIADALHAPGRLELQMYHAEAAPGQYEVVTGPLGPLQAADALVHTRETIYNVASKHGLRATFAPRVYMDSCTFLSSLSFRFLTKLQTQAEVQHTHTYPFTPLPHPPLPPPHQT